MLASLMLSARGLNFNPADRSLAAHWIPIASHSGQSCKSWLVIRQVVVEQELEGVGRRRIAQHNDIACK